MHRVGGLEKEDGTGNVSYDPENHDKMVRIARREDRRHRQRHPAASTSTTTTAPSSCCSVGRHVGRGDRGGAPHPGPRPARSRTRTCGT